MDRISVYPEVRPLDLLFEPGVSSVRWMNPRTAPVSGNRRARRIGSNIRAAMCWHLLKTEPRGGEEPQGGGGGDPLPCVPWWPREAQSRSVSAEPPGDSYCRILSAGPPGESHCRTNPCTFCRNDHRVGWPVWARPCGLAGVGWPVWAGQCGLASVGWPVRAAQCRRGQCRSSLTRTRSKAEGFRSVYPVAEETICTTWLGHFIFYLCRDKIRSILRGFAGS